LENRVPQNSELEFVSDKIEGEITRGRSYASVLFIPRRKMSLCEALHWRRSWPDLSSWKAAMGSSPEWGERGKEEEERGRGLGAAWGAARGGVPWELWAARSCIAVLLVVSAVREKKRRKEKGGGKQIEGKEKEKNMENF
jgi:hypothetical protein